MIINDVIRGSLKLTSLPDLMCFNSFTELLQQLPNFLSVEVPKSITNVTIGHVQPNEDERDHIWYRFDVSGNFIAPYVFVKGKWRVAYTFAPNQLIRKVGDDSRLYTGTGTGVQDGFLLADAANASVTAAEAAFLQTTQWFRDPTNTYWTIFDVTFIGY